MTEEALLSAVMAPLPEIPPPPDADEEALLSAATAAPPGPDPALEDGRVAELQRSNARAMLAGKFENNRVLVLVMALNRLNLSQSIWRQCCSQSNPIH